MSTILTTPRASALLALIWLVWLTALQWSVVRFRVLIVLILTATAAYLTMMLWRRLQARPGPRSGALVLLGSVLALWLVPLFSYLRGGWQLAAYLVVTVVALIGAGLLWSGHPALAKPAFAVAVIGHLTLGVVTIVGDPAPKIDVWVVLQQASDVMGRGESPYAAHWSDSPGVQDLFPYLPWMALLLAPGRWLAGDVRWALLLWSLILLAGIAMLARQRGRAMDWRWAAIPALLLVAAPGGITQVDQAWTEPLLAALIVWWAVLVRRGHAWWAILPLALACASKQHLALLMPMLLVWRPFGWRRTLATGGLAAALMAPWVVLDVASFFQDTVTALVSFHPIRFANTWYLFFLNEFGITLPFWVTGCVVLTAVLASVVLVWKRQPPLTEVLLAMAVVLLMANVVNKQAFYNQFWLSAALVAASWAIPRTGQQREDSPEHARPLAANHPASAD